MPDLNRDALDYAIQWIEYRQRTNALPGLVLGIRSGADLVVEEAFGLADIERGIAMTPAHRFRVASHSKMYAATAVLQLVEQARLRFDDRVSDHLVGVGDRPIGSVTIRQLLNHAGGIFRDGSDIRFWALETSFPTGPDVVADATAADLVLEPSERFKYSNVGYAILGEIVEAVTGTSYVEHLRQAVLEPLGVADTTADLTPDADERTAIGYTHARYGMQRLPVPSSATFGYAPAAGICTTARDLLEFVSAQFHGDDRLLTDASKREAHHGSWDVAGAPTRYGLGFASFELSGRQMNGHGGGYPGFVTFTAFDPADALAVTVLANCVDSAAQALVAGVVAIVTAAPGPLAKAPEVDPDRARRFTGRFMSAWGTQDVALIGNRLVHLSPDLPSPLDGFASFEIIDDETLRFADDGGYGSPGEQVSFTFDDEGRATSMIKDHLVSVPPEEYLERTRSRFGI